MTRLWPTAYMPSGTTITTEDTTATKQTDGPHEPFPWVTPDGTRYGNEWAQQQIDAGAATAQPEGQ
jgi:hypothetical protein